MNPKEDRLYLIQYNGNATKVGFDLTELEGNKDIKKDRRDQWQDRHCVG